MSVVLLWVGWARAEPPAEPGAGFGSAAEVLARFDGEPTIGEVHAWVERHTHTSPAQVGRWLSQSASFAALPEVTLEYELQNDYDLGFDYQTADGAEPAAGTDVLAVSDDAGQGQTQEYQLRLKWQLDELVMSSEKIRVINEAQDLARFRDQVLADATRLYFERRRLQVERLVTPTTDPAATAKEELRLLELTARLDALTGGAFSAACAGVDVRSATRIGDRTRERP